MSERLKEASRENSHRRSKKELKEQRSFFRDVCRTLDSGDSPEVALKIRGEAIHFASWAAIKQLQSFRGCLGPGLAVHLATNQLLRDVFDLGEVRTARLPARGMSKVEKRIFQGKNSDMAKGRTQERRRGVNPFVSSRASREACSAMARRAAGGSLRRMAWKRSFVDIGAAQRVGGEEERKAYEAEEIPRGVSRGVRRRAVRPREKARQPENGRATGSTIVAQSIRSLRDERALGSGNEALAGEHG